MDLAEIDVAHRQHVVTYHRGRHIRLGLAFLKQRSRIEAQIRHRAKERRANETSRSVPARCERIGIVPAMFRVCGSVSVGIGSHSATDHASNFNRLRWCCRWVSNLRPLPYQGSALPLSYGSVPAHGSSRREWEPIHEGVVAGKVGGSSGG